MTTQGLDERTAPVAAPDGVASVKRSVLDLAVDIVVPVAAYFVAKDAFQASLIASLIVSSIVPVVRAVAGYALSRRLNAIAALILAVNVAGIALSFVSGDVRLICAKDSVLSSVVAVAMIVSVRRGKPLMSAGLQPFVTRGRPERLAAWLRLSVESAAFQRYERRFTAIWGVTLLADCVARLMCALFAPISILGWISTPILIGASVIAVVVAGAAAADPITRLVHAAAESTHAE